MTCNTSFQLSESILYAVAAAIVLYIVQASCCILKQLCPCTVAINSIWLQILDHKFSCLVDDFDRF